MPQMNDAVTPVMVGVHHVGLTVANRDAALKFWEGFLGKPARWATTLDRPYLGKIVGMPGVRIEAAFIDLPGGVVVELLDYQVADRSPNPDRTSNPGNAHLCIRVDDAAASWRKAIACGARPLTPDGPVDIDGGPNVGARGAYLRIHDGITLEIFQPPPQGKSP
ncbi:VOC family protein [Mesorhizobium sp. LHD-90]|uniref:VOC family protein n=1 Tax=Mesorhizobium sp. LHD-90 TaxID=3071414 RepID=UPI0027E1F2D3|nr:VOC family protein [Mesorhizobium sp. LHD-90]MDQ6433250.1 VOC family protein [Mesorhizobium sp. LHD-90]